MWPWRFSLTVRQWGAIVRSRPGRTRGGGGYDVADLQGCYSGWPPMRICLFTPTFLPLIGGAERSADVVVRGLIGRGHDVRVLAQEQAAGKAELPYPVHYYRRPFAQHLWPEVLARPLKKLHRQWPFDVVLAFYSYPVGYAASRVKKQLGFGLVISPRGKDLHDRFIQARRFRRMSIMRAGYRGADQIVAISHWLVGRLHDQIGDPMPEAQVVYNGIDLAEHDAALAATRDGRVEPVLHKPFALHMARVAPVKEQALAVRAIAQLGPTLAEAGMEYAVVGDGRDLPALRQLVKRLGLGDVVKVLGMRTGAEKYWLLDNAAFFVTTSRAEALGTVVVESMASGLPILASDLPAHRELIEGKGWGLMFRSGDVDDLAAKMRLMIETDRQPMRRRALEARRSFTLDAMVAGYEEACVIAGTSAQEESDP